MPLFKGFLDCCFLSVEADNAADYFLDDGDYLDDGEDNNKTKNASPTTTIQLEDDGYVLPKTPQHFLLLKEIRQNQRNTNCSSEVDGEIKIKQKTAPIPVDAVVTVLPQKYVPKTSTFIKTESPELDSPRIEDEGSMGAILEYPQFLDLEAQIPPVPVFLKLSRRKRIKRAIKRLFGCYKEPAIVSPVFPSLMIDDVTTLHVFRGDEEAETGHCAPVAELKVRRANV